MDNYTKAQIGSSSSSTINVRDNPNWKITLDDVFLLTLGPNGPTAVPNLRLVLEQQGIGLFKNDGTPVWSCSWIDVVEIALGDPSQLPNKRDGVVLAVSVKTVTTVTGSTPTTTTTRAARWKYSNRRGNTNQTGDSEPIVRTHRFVVPTDDLETFDTTIKEITRACSIGSSKSAIPGSHRPSVLLAIGAVIVTGVVVAGLILAALSADHIIHLHL